MTAENKHVLKLYGNPHDDKGRPVDDLYVTVGRAKCSCGWLGPSRSGWDAHLERRADHRAHKAALTAESEASES